jgi:hypothetical protein
VFGVNAITARELQTEMRAYPRNSDSAFIVTLADMAASDYQRVVQTRLRRHFEDVRLEWSIARSATDALARDVTIYAPRVDVAVGPFNTTPGPDADINDALLPRPLRELFDGRPSNPNPRCLLAIEVCYSGSSKHIMGDMLNAGALGLYGFVVGDDRHMPKIRRIGRYLEVLAELGKVPWLFRNVAAISTADFDALVA